MISLIIKMLAGALAVYVIALLSESKSFVLASLVPLFPMFALIAYFIVGTQHGVRALHSTALFGLWLLIPYAVYLLVVYWLSMHLSLLPTLLCAVAAWCAASALLLFEWFRLHPPGK